jgi:hypothetical protein
MTLIVGILIIIWIILGVLYMLGEYGILKGSLFNWIPKRDVTISVAPKQVTKEVKVTVAPKAKVETKAKPVVKEVEKDEDAMANVQFFKGNIQENKGFYESLTAAEKTEFNELFVLDTPKHIVKELVYQINGNNQAFFTTVFNFIFKYRKIISLSLLTKLFNELVSIAGSEASTLALLNEAMIRTAYARRKDTAFLTSAFEVAKSDVALQQTKLKPSNTYVYSFVRLAIILERMKRYDEALVLVNDALQRQLSDKTVGGFAGRKVRILEKKNQKA